MTQHRDTCNYSLLSPQSFHPQSLLRCLQPTLFLLLPEPQVRDRKWKVVCWPFKWLSVSLVVYLWQRATLPLFTTGCYLCTFWALVFYAGDRSLGFGPHSSQGDPTCHLIIPPGLLPVASSQPSWVSTALLTRQIVPKLVLSVRGYKAILSLLFIFLCWVTSPQFNCNSRFVLGGG